MSCNLSNIDQFSKFFHWHIHKQHIFHSLYTAVVKNPTTPDNNISHFNQVLAHIILE